MTTFGVNLRPGPAQAGKAHEEGYVGNSTVRSSFRLLRLLAPDREPRKAWAEAAERPRFVQREPGSWMAPPATRPRNKSVRATNMRPPPSEPHGAGVQVGDGQGRTARGTAATPHWLHPGRDPMSLSAGDRKLWGPMGLEKVRRGNLARRPAKSSMGTHLYQVLPVAYLGPRRCLAQGTCQYGRLTSQ